jgi:hypothetical protein
MLQAVYDKVCDAGVVVEKDHHRVPRFAVSLPFARCSAKKLFLRFRLSARENGMRPFLLQSSQKMCGQLF